MNRKGRTSLPSKYVLMGLTLVCVMLLFASYATGYSGEPVRSISNYIFVPMQKGLDYVGDIISINSNDTKTKEQLIAENEQLQKKIDEDVFVAQVDIDSDYKAAIENISEVIDINNDYLVAVDGERRGSFFIF